MSNHSSNKAVIISLIGNLSIAALKVGGFLLTKSSAMLSEAVHSFADSGNQVLLLIGAQRAKKKSDHRFNFGYSPQEFLFSFIVAIVLFSLGSLVSLYEGIEHIIHPESIHNIGIVLVLLFCAIAVEGYSLWEGLKSKPKGESLYSYLKKTTDSTTAVVVIENYAALVGLVASFVCLLLAYYVHPIFDGIGATFTGVVLGCLSIFLAVELSHLITGESLSRADTYKINLLIKKHCGGIEKINYIYSRVNGNNEYIFIVSIDPLNSDNGKDIEDISHKIKQLVLAKYPTSKVFVDFSKEELE